MPHFYIRRVPDKLHLRWKRLAFALKADMREVALNSIEAYVSAKEEEIRKLLSKDKDKDKGKSKTNGKKKAAATKKNGGKNG